MNKLSLIIAICFSALLLSCKGESIHTYQVPKEKPVSMPAMPAMQSAPMVSAEHPTHELTWDSPSSWQEQVPSSMRTASFLAKGSNGLDVDISIVVLGGGAGGQLANVNRWRDQIGLPALTEESLSSHITKHKTAHFNFLLSDMTSQENLIDSKYKKRIVAAMVDVNEKTWFFKMTGESSAVESVKKSFLHFLDSVKPS